MENHFYHSKRLPFNVTFFITHMRNLRNGCYANEQSTSKVCLGLFLILKRAVCIAVFVILWVNDLEKLLRCASLFQRTRDASKLSTKISCGSLRFMDDKQRFK